MELVGGHEPEGTAPVTPHPSGTAYGQVGRHGRPPQATKMQKGMTLGVGEHQAARPGRRCGPAGPSLPARARAGAWSADLGGGGDRQVEVGAAWAPRRWARSCGPACSTCWKASTRRPSADGEHQPVEVVHGTGSVGHLVTGPVETSPSISRQNSASRRTSTASRTVWSSCGWPISPAFSVQVLAVVVGPVVVVELLERPGAPARARGRSPPGVAAPGGPTTLAPTGASAGRPSRSGRRPSRPCPQRASTGRLPVDRQRVEVRRVERAAARAR